MRGRRRVPEWGASPPHRLNHACLTTLVDLVDSLRSVDWAVNSSTESWRTMRGAISVGSRSALVFEDNDDLVRCDPEDVYA